MERIAVVEFTIVKTYEVDDSNPNWEEEVNDKAIEYISNNAEDVNEYTISLQ